MDDRETLVEGLLGVGRNQHRLAAFGAAAHAYQEAWGLLADGGDRRGEAEALLAWGLAHWAEGECERARSCFEQAAAIAAELGQPATGLEAATRNMLGTIALSTDDVDAALREHGRALTLAVGAGDAAAEANALLGLAAAHTAAGQPERGLAYYEQALQVGRTAGEARRRLLGVAGAGPGRRGARRGRGRPTPVCRRDCGGAGGGRATRRGPCTRRTRRAGFHGRGLERCDGGVRGGDRRAGRTRAGA